MSPKTLHSFNIVSEWVSSISPHMERPRPAPLTSGPQKTFRPAPVSKSPLRQFQHHVINSNRHLSRQSAVEARPASHAASRNEKRQTRRPTETTRAEIEYDTSDRTLNTCSIIDVDEMAECEDSSEASKPGVEPLQFVRRVDLDGTAAGRSLIRSMLERF